MAVPIPSLFVESKNIIVLALSLFVLALFPRVSLAQAGELDTSFDGDGKVTTRFSDHDDRAYSVAIQADGKIVAAGHADYGGLHDFALARYEANGNLDTGFDGDGKVTTDFGSRDEAQAVTIQADGKIVVAGVAHSDFALARYNANGSLDTSFDGDGKVTTDFAGRRDLAYSVAIQTDGKIVVAGYAHMSVSNDDFALARYNADGSLDTSFDGDGKATTDFAGGSGDVARSVAIQTDGKIVVAGDISMGLITDFALARYNPDGTLDNSFDGDGKVTTRFSDTHDRAYSVAIQADGKIVAAGYAFGTNSDFALVRYNADGSLDTSFDGDGKVTTDFAGSFVSYDWARSVAIQADGKIVAAGSARIRDTHDDFALTRYNADGSLDTGFDCVGKVTTDFAGSYEYGFSAAIQPDGKIIAVGSTRLSGHSSDFALARYEGVGPPNRPPVADAGGTYSGTEGEAIALSGASASDPNCDPLTVSWLVDTPLLCSFSDDTVLNPDLTCTDNGIFIVTLTADDGTAAPVSSDATVTVAPPNTPPVADAGGPYSGNEGAVIALSSASASDPDSDPLTISWLVDTPLLCSFSDDTVLNPDLTCTDNGIFTVTLTVDDGTAAPVNSDATVAVDNVDPSVDAFSVPADPIDINDQPVAGLSTTFTDPGTADTHTCTVNYGDGPQAGTINAGNCEGPDHTYAEAGVFEVTIEVTDDDGGVGSATATEFIVIYDPDGGFVTGGGWIDSPAGAYPADLDLTGKANFGFVSTYKKGASVPTGQTEFQFKASDLNFHSSSYDWLVIAGKKAMYKGTGTIDGAGHYGFQLSAIDAALTPSTDVDLFRIRIWDKDNADALVYDNQVGETEDNANPTTALAGGSIKIHEGRSKKTDELAELPTEFALYGNYPNPFNPSTSIRFDLPERSEVRLVVFDLLGREVAILADQQMPQGRHSVTWEADDAPSGVFLYRLEAGNFVQTKRMVMLK